VKFEKLRNYYASKSGGGTVKVLVVGGCNRGGSRLRGKNEGGNRGAGSGKERLTIGGGPFVVPFVRKRI